LVRIDARNFELSW